MTPKPHTSHTHLAYLLTILAKQRRAIDEKQNALSDEYIDARNAEVEALRVDRDAWQARALAAEARCVDTGAVLHTIEAMTVVDTEGGAG